MKMPGGQTAIFGKPISIQKLTEWYPRVLPPPIVKFRVDYAPGGALGTYILNHANMEFLQLTKRQEAAVKLCDGSRTALDVVSEIRRLKPDHNDLTQDSVLEDLDTLYQNRCLYWTDQSGNGGASTALVQQVRQKMDRFGLAGDLLWISVGKRTGMPYLYSPVALTLILTLRCNARCSICFIKPSGNRRYPEAEMETSVVLGILEQAAALGVDRIRLFGGEIFLRKDLPQILQHGQRLNLGLTLYSNGILLASQDKADELADIIKGYPYVYVQVSLDGLGDAHSNQRSGAGIDVVKQAIYNLARCGIPFATNTVLNRDNVSEIENITSFSHQHGAENIIFNTIKLCGGGSELEKLRLSPAEVNSLWKRFNRLKSLYPDQEIYANLQDTILRAQLLDSLDMYPKKAVLEGSQTKLAHNCLAFTYSMAIAPNGSILPCEFFAPFPEYWGERIQNHELKWAWDKSKPSHFMRKLPIEGKCQECEYRETCDMGCPVENRMVTGSFTAENPFCWYQPGDPASAEEYPVDYTFIHRSIDGGVSNRK